MLPAARTAWNKVEAARLDNSVLSLSDRKLAEWDATRQAEGETLNAVELAFRSGDKAALIKAAAALRGNFAKLFTLFGDFDSLK